MKSCVIELKLKEFKISIVYRSILNLRASLTLTSKLFSPSLFLKISFSVHRVLIVNADTLLAEKFLLEY